MIERVHLKLSKVTGCYEVIKTERLSESEEAQRLYDAQEKANWDEQSRIRTAQNKAVRKIATNCIIRGLSDQQIHECTNLSYAEIEKLKTKVPLQTSSSAQ